MKQCDPIFIRSIVHKLADYTLLQRSDRVPNPTEQALMKWEGWNPIASLFHFSTKDVPYAVDRTRLGQIYRRRAAQSSMPKAVKQYPHNKQIALLPVQTNGEFPEVLLSRRTWRKFSHKPIALEKFSTLLGLTFGIQDWLSFHNLGRLALKTSPSAGARHPIEAYVLVRRVNDIAPGFYHYAAGRHHLERLSKHSTLIPISKFIPAQPWYREAAAVVFLTAVFERTLWKYKFPRAYRTVLIDAGHICQTFCLLATWLGLAPFCTMALADSEIERALQIDGVTEGIIYAAGVATRPLNYAFEGDPGEY